ncbi:amidohydrolase family protein [Natronolimnobius sp. AArcel1]|uniref:amidohydrolase family protein n=1 Tax=Natronolimnobius sp. AArcel1 TaxID=1679093 RepID=UPI0013EAC798|nr:amidohydrolase family protein [Natronolimnobius sp. AArcel1]NGM69695.1 amidohydrolase family protein [Natronolimnobius sp. AArcel1]
MLELEHGFRVVDVYTRLVPDGGPGRARAQTRTPDQLEREMHQAGITKSVIFPPARAETEYVAANNGVARRSVDRPFIAFARINGTEHPEGSPTGLLRNAVSRPKPYHTTPEDIEKYAYDDRFHGFVFDPTVDNYPDEDVLAVLEDVGLPLLVRAGVDAPPAELTETVLGHDFPVIVAQFGGHPLDRELMAQMIDLLDEYDECYLETSFVRYRQLLERAVLEHPDRVFFGSGAPACHPNVAVMEILTLDVSEDMLRRVFSKNVCRIIDALGPDAALRR